jgi:hypothetical protein
MNLTKRTELRRIPDRGSHGWHYTLTRGCNRFAFGRAIEIGRPGMPAKCADV